MESGGGEGASSSVGEAAAAAAEAAEEEERTPSPTPLEVAPLSSQPQQPQQQLSRYESQKRRDWNTFLQYLKNHKPPLTLALCSGAHVIEFLKYLDQFGKTKVHVEGCPYFGDPNPPAQCACPLKQAWGSLDALIGRLRAAYEETGGKPESNPFAARAVRIYLREVREGQAKARGIPYEKKKRKRSAHQAEPSSAAAIAAEPSSTAAAEASSLSAAQPSPLTSSAAATAVAAPSMEPSSPIKHEEPAPAAAAAEASASDSASATQKSTSSKTSNSIVPSPRPSSSPE